MKQVILGLCIFFFNAVTLYSQKVTTIPFEELLGGVIMLKAKVGTYPDTLNFVFDSGSSHISLDSSTAHYLGLKVNKTENLVNGIGGKHKVSKTEPMSLLLPNLTLDSLSFNVNDYSLLTESYGERIDGIIGFALLSKFIFNVNFDSSLIHVYKRGDYKYPKKGYVWKFNINRIPSTSLTLTDDRKITANNYIDCGAGLCLLLTESFVEDSALLRKNKKPIITQVDGVGGKSRTRITTIKSLSFGKYTFKNVPTYLYLDTDDLLNYPATVGLIGNDILRRFNWVLNYAKKEMHLIPNKNFKEPFDYSYSGVSVYMIDGFITIDDIIPNSPGALCGLKNGDIILSINETVITTIKKAKDMLQDAGKVLKIAVIRNQKVLTFYLKVKKIK